MKAILTIIICFGMVFCGLVGHAAEAEPQLMIKAQNPDGEAFYDAEKGIAQSDNGVIVEYGETVMFAKKITIFQEKGWMLAEGSVRMEREGQTWTGDSISYDYKNKKFNADMFRSSQGFIFVAGDVLTADRSNEVYTATGTMVTADDYAKPFYSVKAKKITLVPGKYIEARNATLYVGDVPVMYLPYYRRSMGRHPNNFSFVPGYRSRYGGYLLGSYNWILNTNLSGALNVDYRTKRGLGAGPDLDLNVGKWGEGKMSFYYLNDGNPDTSVLMQPIRSDREKFWYEHKLSLSNNLSAKMAMRYQSDPMLMHDFFERDYRQNVQPSSFVEVNKLWRNWSLDAYAQPRLIDFYETVEKLPDIKLTGLRQQLGESPIFYESDSSFGWYRRLYSNDQLPDYSAFRGDTYHQLIVPHTFFGWLNVTPRIGGRFTQYSAADGPGGFTRSEDRAVFNTGMELSTKLSRTWPGYRSKLLDMDGLRHIAEPSFNYAFVPEPKRRPLELPQFDYEMRSYRLLPMDYPDYNSIDSIDSQNAVRLGLRNRIQTKRKAGIDNLLYWALYTDWRIDPRAEQGTFSDVYSDVDFMPRSWLILSQELRQDVNDGVLKELNHRISILPGDRWTVTIGNRYLRYDSLYPTELSQNLYYLSVFYRMNENYAFRTTHHFEARDGRMEEQSYTLYRDLRSWTAAITLRQRNERFRNDDFTIAFTLSLKAFPRYKLGQDADKPYYLFGS